MQDAVTYLKDINIMSTRVTNLSGLVMQKSVKATESEFLQSGLGDGNIIRSPVIRSKLLPHHQEDLLLKVIPGDAKCETLASVVLEVAWKPARTMTSMLGACCPNSNSPEAKGELERSTAIGPPADVEAPSS